MDELSTQQERALNVLFLTGSSAKAAKVAGVSPRTLYNWRQLPAWVAEVRLLEKEQAAELTDLRRVAGRVGLRSLLMTAQGKQYNGKKDEATTPGGRTSASVALVKVAGLEPAVKVEVNQTLEQKEAALEAALEAVYSSLTEEQIEERRAAIMAKIKTRIPEPDLDEATVRAWLATKGLPFPGDEVDPYDPETAAPANAPR